MKKTLLILSFCLFTLICYSQNPELKTTFTDFTSRSGQIMSFEDFNTITFTSFNGNMTAKKRIVRGGEVNDVFLLFTLEDKYSPRTAAVAQDDVMDLFSAIEKLKTEVVTDIASKSDYLEKYYITKDYFKIGYYVNRNGIRWYVDLETRLNNSTFFIKDIDEFIASIRNILK